MYYIFIGQLKTTSGQPHKTTGSYNTYGDLMAFSKRKDRDLYYNACYARAMYTSLIRTNLKDAKRLFFAGMAQLEFNDYIRYVDSDMLDYGRYDLVEFHYNNLKGE